MEQNVDIPVPSPRDRRARRTVDQNVDIPVDCKRTHGGLQGFSPGQSSTQRTVAPNDDLPVPGRRPSRGFPSGQGSQRTVEQIIDIPVSRTRAGGGLPGFHFKQSSTARGGAQGASWLRSGAEELVAGLEGELGELLAISADTGFAPQQQARFDEVLRELSRL